MITGDPDGRGRVELVGLERYPSLRDPGLRPWLERVVGELAPGVDSFTVRFVGDRTMRRLSRVFRGKDATTDVLSFPGELTPEGNHLGDVVLSVPRARAQAADQGHAAAREVRLLVLHGVLHCLGHDHETDDGEMDRFERRLRRRYLSDSGE